MNTQQLAVLKAHVQANPDTNGFYVGGNLPAVAALLNVDAAPVFYATKKSLSRHDILTGTSIEGTTFAWAGAAYITRNQGERDAFREMFNSTGEIDPAVANIVAAFQDIFSGTGGAGNRAHVTSMSKRTATRFEKLFATGLGTLVAPATMALQGPVQWEEMVGM